MYPNGNRLEDEDEGYSPLKIAQEAEALLPRDTYTFIDWLDKAYPERCIKPGESLEEAHRYSGTRDLIRELVLIKQEEINADTSDPEE